MAERQDELHERAAADPSGVSRQMADNFCSLAGDGGQVEIAAHRARAFEDAQQAEVIAPPAGLLPCVEVASR